MTVTFTTSRTGLLSAAVLAAAVITAQGQSAGVSRATKAVAAPAGACGDWPYYGRDPGARRFSPLTQITPQNVATLTRAWTFDTGAAAMQVTPLVIDGVMYVTAGANIFALEPETAKVLWKFSNTDMSRRGLAYWPGDAQTGAAVLHRRRRRPDDRRRRQDRARSPRISAPAERSI